MQTPENGAPSVRAGLWKEPLRPPCRLSALCQRDCKAGVAGIVYGAALPDRTNKRTPPLPGERAHFAAQSAA